MILSERYKARRYAEGLAEGRSEGLANAVERAIRQTAGEIDDSVGIRIDTSEWFSQEVVRVVLTKGESKTEAFRVTMEQALSSQLYPLLKGRIESWD